MTTICSVVSLAVLATYLIIVVGKSAAAYVIVRAFRHPRDTALLISASLAQIGEFSFMLVTLGLALGMLPEAGRDLVLAGAILSITTNPAIFMIASWLRARRLGAAPAKQESAAAAPHEQNRPFQASETDHVVVIGYGRVGKRVHAALIAANTPSVVIEADLDRVDDIRESGGTAVLGNAARVEVQKAAGVDRARHLLVAVPNGLEGGEIVARAREMNPDLRIVSRAHLDAEVEHLLTAGADRVIMGEREIARLMVQDIRRLAGADEAGARPA